jgi:ATP/maltotriose-dependent transcriptional regulator MalT
MQMLSSTPRTPGSYPPELSRLDTSCADVSDRRPAGPQELTLICTKTQIPRNCGETLRRDRLEALSEEVPQRLLTLVMAPPGCGKTTLACQWADQLTSRGISIAWLSIDAEDNDPLRFLLYMHQAVANARFGRGATSARTARPAAFHSAAEALSAFINWVADIGDELVIVLDNYSWITNAEVHTQVSIVLDKAPPNLHLVLLTSATPPLQLGRLRVQNRLLELNSSAIRFNRSEALELLQRAAGPLVPSAHLHELYKLTQGWAAAVRIVAHSIIHQGNSSASNRGLIDCRTFDAIDEYLDDLFVSYPDDLMEMMIDTAIVDSVSAPLCRALTERDETELFFCQLKQQQVLLPLDPERGTFAYPALVRRHLYKKLARKGNPHLSRLHQRALGWYSQNGQWENAIDHALATGETELALRWMEFHAMPIAKAGHFGTLIRWHQKTTSLSMALPQRVQLAFAWAYALSHSLEAALGLLAQIEAPLASPRPLSSAVQAECDVIRAAGHSLADHLEQALEFSTRCSHRFSDDWIGTVLANVQLCCRFRTGQWTAFFTEPTVLNAQVEEEVHNYVLRLSVLGLAGLLRGQLEFAEKYCVDALRISPVESDKGALHFSAWPAGVLASIYYETGRLDELEALLNHRLNDIASSAYLDCIMAAFLSAAGTAAKRGKPAEALRLLEQAEGVAIRRGWVRLEAAVLLERMRLFLNDNRLEEARGCLRRFAQFPRGGTASEHSSPLCSISQITAIANAYLAIHSGCAEEAISPLQAVMTQFSSTGNELFCIRLGTLLSIAYLKSGHGEAAKRMFRETMEKAARGGFVSAVIDQGADTETLLSGLRASLRDSENDERIRKHCERLLRHRRSCAGPSTVEIEARDNRDNTACTLTPKEHQVLTLMAHGQSNKEIARSLTVAPETIKTHLKNIFSKLSVDRRIQAVAKAQLLGLLTPISA